MQINIESVDFVDDHIVLNLAPKGNFVSGIKPGYYFLEEAAAEDNGNPETKKIKKPRSRNANAFLWALISEMSEKSYPQIPKNEIYRNAIREVGIYKDFNHIECDQAPALIAAWNNQGTAWPAEILDYEPDDPNSVTVRCYYGSSTYGSREMSRLIDYVVEDAEAMGIKVDPQKVKKMKDAWPVQQKEKGGQKDAMQSV